MKGLVKLCLISIIFLNCSTKPESKVVAQVYDVVLTEEMIKDDIGQKFSNKNLRKQYIDKWIRKELLIRKTEKYDNQELKNLVTSYREALLTERFREDYVEKNLDYVITLDEINSAFDALRKNYPLKSSIFKVELLVTKSDHHDILDLKKFFKDKEYEKWHESIAQNFELYLQDTSKWQSWSNISQHIPVDVQKKLRLKSNMDFMHDDSTRTYFIRIFDLKKKHQEAPKSYLRPFLEKSILKKRKEVLLNNLDEQLYKTALKNDKIIINE